MFFQKGRVSVSDKVETIIGAGVTVKGEIIASSPVRIDGVVDGSIRCESDVYVGQEAKVFADIDAKNVSIAGEVHGNIRAQMCLRISATGKVYGDVKATTLAIAQGAAFCGMSQMNEPAAQGKADTAGIDIQASSSSGPSASIAQSTASE